jgi:hypothetical protein
MSVTLGHLKVVYDSPYVAGEVSEVVLPFTLGAQAFLRQAVHSGRQSSQEVYDDTWERWVTSETDSCRQGLWMQGEDCRVYVPAGRIRGLVFVPTNEDPTRLLKEAVAEYEAESVEPWPYQKPPVSSSPEQRKQELLRAAREILMNEGRT